MRSRRRHAPADEAREEDDDEDDLPAVAPRRRRGRSGRPPVRGWGGEPPEDDDEPEPARPRLFHRDRERVYFRARDSLYFEPLVALSIIVLLLVSLWAFTQNWPPVYVVESESMQHGSTDVVGLINTGDLVLAQRIATAAVVTYVAGEHTGYTTYGELGDVLLYYPNGSPGTPVIHRALIYLEAQPNGTWNAPSLAGLTCGTGANGSYTAGSTASGCGTRGLHGVLTLHSVGWQSVDVPIVLDQLGHSSGFVTMGDNNYDPGPPAIGKTDQAFGLSPLVQGGWVLGAARGMVPWFGSIKLLLQGTAMEVPAQSWEYLGLSIVGLVGAAMTIHWVLRAEGIEDPRRRSKEAEEEEEEEDDEADPEDPEEGRPRRSWLHPIRAWRDSENEDEDAGPLPRSPRRAAGSASSGRRGRPKPHVGRAPPRDASKRHRRSDDSDEDL